MTNTKNRQTSITPQILDEIETPVWLLEEDLLRHNLQIMRYIKEQTGIKILLALKGFAFWREADMTMEYLDGVCASGLHEALLGSDKYGSEVHTYSPAYRESDIAQIARISHHMVFNSPSELYKYGEIASQLNPSLSIGLRVNPEYSAAPTELYNPCAPYSRLGTLAQDINMDIVHKIEGIHIHALCEQDSAALESVLGVIENKFGIYLPYLKWINLGGGHHITRSGYRIDHLIGLLNKFSDRYPYLQIYIEPGEAIGWQSGVLIASVLDIVHNGIDIAILDTSAEAHMPDTIIMPYRAEVRGASLPYEKPYTYRLAGNTCLAGDIMGDYSFDQPLVPGDKIIFEDQMHYTMVKATTFNGIPLPSIAVLRSDGYIEYLHRFDYQDFVNRLG